jgi:hypothetical protein
LGVDGDGGIGVGVGVAASWDAFFDVAWGASSSSLRSGAMDVAAVRVVDVEASDEYFEA